MYSDIASLKKHHDALCILLENLQYNSQVIGITETGIRKDYRHVPVDIPNYSFHQTNLPQANETLHYM